MSIRLHPSKNKKLAPGEPRWWQIEIFVGGKNPIRETMVRQFHTKEEAKVFKAEVIRNLKPPSASLPAATLGQIVPDFLEWYATERRPRSVESWLEGWKNLEPFFTRERPNLLTPAHIDDYKRHRLNQKAPRKETNITHRTVAKELANLSALISFAVRRQICDPLTFKIEGFPKKLVRPRKKIIPAPEPLEKMLSVIRKDLRPLYQTMYYAGLRVSEIRFLTAGNIDLKRNFLLVTGKGDKDRMIPIVEPLKPILAELVKGKKPEDYLFISKRTGKPYSRNLGKIGTSAKKAGITTHMHAHLLRHSFGTHAILYGVDKVALKDIMGHEDESTTNQYIHMAASYLTDQMKSFGVAPNKIEEEKEQPQ